jgi:hypothetical protein
MPPGLNTKMFPDIYSYLSPPLRKFQEAGGRFGRTP